MYIHQVKEEKISIMSYASQNKDFLVHLSWNMKPNPNKNYSYYSKLYKKSTAGFMQKHICTSEKKMNEKNEGDGDDFAD